jgi:dUTP pyrophosphatase
LASNAVDSDFTHHTGSEPVIGYLLSEEAQQVGIVFAAPRGLDAGFDLRSLAACEIAAGNSALISTGLHLAIPPGYVGLVRDRSSVAMRGGLCAAGVIDAAYRGEVKVLMHNLSKLPIRFEEGERIAQCLILPHLSGLALSAAVNLAELGNTERGSGGFGSTGRV